MAMIELYLIRHGLAAERGKDWPDDSKRPLTPEGIARLRKEARGLNAVGVTFDQIVTSPLIRARQTADVFSEELKSRPPIVTADALAPDRPARQPRRERVEQLIAATLADPLVQPRQLRLVADLWRVGNLARVLQLVSKQRNRVVLSAAQGDLDANVAEGVRARQQQQ